MQSFRSCCLPIVQHQLNSPTLQLVGLRCLSTGAKKGGSKPEWMIDAEREARAGQGHKANQLSSLENTFMNSLKSEISAESVNNTTRLQSTLDRLIAELLTLDTKTEAQKQAFDELRNRALGTRSQLIVQREATGFTKDNNNVVESMFPIPRRSN